MKIKDYSDIDVLEAYLLGDLDPRDMYEVEKLSLEDPFVGQALEGLRQSKQLRYNLSLLQKQLQQKVAEKPILKKRWQLTSQRLSIASAAAVLLITVSILFWMKSGTPKNGEEPVSVVLAESADNNSEGNTEKIEVESTVGSAVGGADALSAAKPIDRVVVQPSAIAADDLPLAKASTAVAGVAMAKAAVPFRGVHGQVKDAISGSPIENAKITLVGLSLSTMSTSEGNFRLSVQDEVKFPIKVQITAPGYEELQVSLNDLNEEQSWLLKPVPKS